jgi:hypothetical protein
MMKQAILKAALYRQMLSRGPRMLRGTRAIVARLYISLVFSRSRNVEFY